MRAEAPFKEYGTSTFHFIREIEEHTNTQVADIPVVYKGSNNYVSPLVFPKEQNLMFTEGFHIKTSNGLDMVARLARSDVNMPNFEGFPIEEQELEVIFEAAVYNLLRTESDIRTSRLLYHRVPALHPGPKLVIPQDLAGRRLFLFEKAEGVNNVWDELNAANKV